MQPSLNAACPLPLRARDKRSQALNNAEREEIATTELE